MDDFSTSTRTHLPLFAQGGRLDGAKPGAWLAVAVSGASRPDTVVYATDDEALGMLRKWRSLESWSASGKLAVVRELIRRHPAPDSEPATGDLPADWARELEHEVSAALGISLVSARKLLRLAWSLEARLPGVGLALNEDRVDFARAKMIVEETDVLLDPALLARAEEMILAGLAKCRTWSDVLRLVQRAVVTVDPEGAEKRRKQAEREHARVQFWRENSGTCGLAGTGLPTDEALRANARIEARAQAYRKAGVKRYIDLLRVMAFLDILNGVPIAGRVARCLAEDAEREAQDPQDAHDPQDPAEPEPPTDDRMPDDDGMPEDDDPAPFGDYPVPDYPVPDYPVPEDPCSNCAPGTCPGRDLDPPEPPCDDCGDRDCHCGPAPADARASEPGLPIRGNLTLPLETLQGRAERPGEAQGLGALDPGLVRDLARAGASHPGSEFCLTIVDRHGYAIGHACCKPVRARKTGTRSKSPPGPSPGGAPDHATFTPSGKPGPPGGFGSWILTLPGAPHPFSVDIEPVPTYSCDHRHESKGHDPSDKLRHLIEVRDGKCSFVTCSRHARETDFEHATPYEQGGRTCGCNGHMCSRSCHRTKQSRGWNVTSPQPGFHEWTTPAGRVYVQEPWRYPA